MLNFTIANLIGTTEYNHYRDAITGAMATYRQYIFDHLASGSEEDRNKATYCAGYVEALTWVLDLPVLLEEQANAKKGD